MHKTICSLLSGDYRCLGAFYNGTCAEHAEEIARKLEAPSPLTPRWARLSDQARQQQTCMVYRPHLKSKPSDGTLVFEPEHYLYTARFMTPRAALRDPPRRRPRRAARSWRGGRGTSRASASRPASVERRATVVSIAASSA